MYTDTQDWLISKLDQGDKLYFPSKIAGVRCPNCKALQPISRMNKVNARRGWITYDAHECAGCNGLLFYQRGVKSYLFGIIIALPLLIISAIIGFKVLAGIDSYFGYHLFFNKLGETTPWMIVLPVILFSIPTMLFLTRFEPVKIVGGPSGPVLRQGV